METLTTSLRVTPLRLMLTAMLALVLATVTACDSDGSPSTQAWLHGTWILTFNPDRDSRDDLVFSKDGRVAVHTEDNRVISGLYRVRNDELVLLLEVNENIVDVSFDISPDRKRLTYRNGAYYEKQAPAS